MVSYGRTIRWYGLDGSVSTFTVDKCETPQEALSEAITSAKAFGWTPPRWWQWWRWREPIRSDVTAC